MIAESVQVKTDAFAALYAPYGRDIVKKVIKHHEANGGMSRFEKIKFYNESFLNKIIKDKEVTGLANQFSVLVVEKIIESPYVPGVLEYIQESFKHYKLFISTGTPTDEIKKILQFRNISKYFSEVFGSPSSKIEHINNIMSIYNIKPNELIFYGDSNLDMKSAEDAGIPFILIRNRFNKKFAETYKGKIINNFIRI